LVGIEPASLTAVFRHNAPDRKAQTWIKELAPFSCLEFAVSDAAKGIAAAVEQVAVGRSEGTDTEPEVRLEHGLDVFHTAREAPHVLAQHWRRAEAIWDGAEAASARFARAREQGVDARGPAGPARTAWRQASSALEQVERQEGAWRQAHAALDIFRPDGRLNTRATAEAEIAAALSGLPGTDWTKVRNFLQDPRSLAFLDRMHRRLESAEPRREWREAMVWRWWLRHRRPTPLDSGMALIQAVGREQLLTEPEQASYHRVAAVLSDTVRASSAVECLNSVLRMQQARHRRMTQPMLDLERLYWNCRAFRSGPRKGTGPYRALGLDLPTFDFWELLQTDPAQLTQQLSTQGNTG
jgi:hypothetical protein